VVASSLFPSRSGAIFWRETHIAPEGARE